MRGNQLIAALALAIYPVAAAAAEPAPQPVSEEALAQQLMSGQAWADFCDRMKALGQEIGSERYPGDPLARAEGFRHLARMMVLGLQWRLENASSDFPMFVRHDDDLTPWGGPNVDNTYLRATIDGTSTYRIDGNVTGILNLLISTGEADMHEGKFAIGGDLDISQLKVDKAGHFELILSPTKQEGNWLQTNPAVTFVSIRAF